METTASTLTKMLADMPITSADKEYYVASGHLNEDDIDAIKSVVRKWLEEVGLTDYASLDRDGNVFSATESLRHLLIQLVDEP